MNESNEHKKHGHNAVRIEGCCSPDEVCSATTADKNETIVSLNQGVTADRTTTLNVAGMDCADEVEAIERVLRNVPGIRDFRVSLMAGKVAIGHESSISESDLIKEIGKAGLKASVPSENGENEDAEAAQFDRQISVGVSGALTALGLVLQWAEIGGNYLPIVSFVGAIISGSWFVAPKAIRAVRQFSLDMNVLMTVAVIGACLIGEWAEGASVCFLFALSELLEAFSLNRARRAIKALLTLAPETALVKRSDGLKEVPVKEVTLGEILVVRSGAKVPLDGEIITGKSSINQAPITGESMPVDKKEGDTVFAGTINGEGSLEVKVTKAHEGTTLSKIIHLVEEAQSQKAPSQRFVDKFARIYTPAVFILAILVWIIPPLLFSASWWEWTYRALTLLVIACPCALVISTPVSIVSGLTAMARKGVLIKGGAILEAVGKLQALAVDKTGTITEGKPRVINAITVGKVEISEVIRIAAAIDIHSDHPLAQAVVTYAKEKAVSFTASVDYRSVSGFGAEAKIDGHDYFVGNHRFTHDLGLCSPELEKTLSEIEEQALSVVVVGHKNHDGHQGEVLGILSIGDSIRSGAAAAIKSLHEVGVKKVVMLSGDNQRTANAIAKQAGIDEAHGDLLPDDKIAKIKDLLSAYQFVGMIGDGVNDAPAMAASTVGIAMGMAGTDTAIETADLTLMQDDLGQVATAIRLGKKTVNIIRMNIGFSLAIKAIFLVLALGGYTSLWLAILADTGATLIVIANALRLLIPERETV